MSEVITFTSGKGGVGKTTTTANVGVGLSLLEKKVILIDTDIGLRNLDVVMGLENRIVYNLVDVLKMQSEAGCHKRPQIPESFSHSICMCAGASANHDRGDADAHGGVKGVV